MAETDALVEKVARAICEAGVTPAQAFDLDWEDYVPEALAALTALGLHEGKNVVVDAGAIPAIVRDSMQAAWDDICADTDCYPLDLRKRRGKLYFVPDQWARQAGELAQSSMVNARPEQSNG